MAVMNRPETAINGNATVAYTEAVREGLATALPIALRDAEHQVISDVARHAQSEGVTEDVVREIAELVIAGLGGSAARALADLLVGRLADQGLAEPASWLREALKASKSSRLATLTDFSNNRNQYIKEVEDGQAAFLTRRGVVVAAVLPVTPGQYEEEIYVPAVRRMLAEKEARPPIELTPDQVADIAARGAVAADEYGIDTSGWQRRGPDPELESQVRSQGRAAQPAAAVALASDSAAYR